MRPPPFGQPQFMPRPPVSTATAPTSLAPSSASADTGNGKLTTLFVGAIAAGVSDDWIVKLLEVNSN